LKNPGLHWLIRAFPEGNMRRPFRYQYKPHPPAVVIDFKISCKFQKLFLLYFISGDLTVNIQEQEANYYQFNQRSSFYDGKKN